MNNTIDFLTKDLAKNCAKEILNAFKEKGNSETIEVDFNLSKGKMVEPIDHPNTWFKFDCRDTNGPLRSVYDFLTELWKSEDTSEEDAQSVKDFEKQVTEELKNQVQTSNLADILRQSVFQSVPKELLPIKEIKFRRVEFAGEDEQGYLLKIEKLAKVDSSGQYVGQPQSVAKELIQIHTETGKEFKDIIEEKRLAGDSKYEYVADAQLERYIRDVTVTLSADYSFCENPLDEQKT